MELKALEKMQYGVYIIASSYENKLSGQLANAVMQVTSEPANFAVCISKQNFTFEIIDKSGKFSITALSEDAPFEFMGKFGFRSGRNINKFENVEYNISESGIPIVTAYATAAYEFDVIKKLDVDTHVIFIGKIKNMMMIDENKNTMTYDYYHKVKGGLTSKNAPTYKGS